MPVVVSKANPQLLSGYSGLVTNKTYFIDVDIFSFARLKTYAARTSSLPRHFSIKLDWNYPPRILNKKNPSRQVVVSSLNTIVAIIPGG